MEDIPRLVATIILAVMLLPIALAIVLWPFIDNRAPTPVAPEMRIVLTVASVLLGVAIELYRRRLDRRRK